MIKKGCVIFAGLIISLTAYGIPAKLGVTTVKQPDGSQIKIRVHGNGEMHYTTTDDNILLIQEKDGFYYFGEISDEGKIISTGVKANETGNKTGTMMNDASRTRLREGYGISTRASQSGKGMYKTNYPTKGTPRVPVILVEFQDLKFSDSYDVKQYFTEMISGDNFTGQGTPGSIKKYFEDQSSGKFIPQFDVYGPVTLPREASYYGSNAGIRDPFSHYMVSHSVKILDPEVDFSIYDEDGDGDIDFIYVIYAGLGENRGAGAEYVWPHAGYIKGDADFCSVDGKWANYYACSNELISEGEPEGIAAFIHEYSHIIGLPDLYTTDPYNFHYKTVGPYSILDYGVYNNDGRTPPNYTAYERNALKWNEPIVISDKTTMTLDEISTGQFALIETDNSNEFFLFENRQLKGWDEYLPAHGMVIWHIDYNRNMFSNNEVNIDPDHQYVDLVEANNTPGYTLDYKTIENSKEFTFPGVTNNTSFTATTSPAFLAWSGFDPGLPITNIKEEDGKIIFDVKGGDQVKEPEEETPDNPDDTPDNPDDTPDNPEDTPDNPDDTQDNPDDTPDNPDDTPDNPDDTPDNPDDTPDNPDDTPDNPDDTPDNPDDTPDNPDDTPDNPDDTPDNPDDTLDNPDDTPDNPDDTPDNPDDTPDNPDDNDSIESVIADINGLYHVYNLSGSKIMITEDLKSLQKGLYIINGKKVYVK